MIQPRCCFRNNCTCAEQRLQRHSPAAFSFVMIVDGHSLFDFEHPHEGEWSVIACREYIQENIVTNNNICIYHPAWTLMNELCRRKWVIQTDIRIPVEYVPQVWRITYKKMRMNHRHVEERAFYRTHAVVWLIRHQYSDINAEWCDKSTGNLITNDK